MEAPSTAAERGGRASASAPHRRHRIGGRPAAAATPPPTRCSWRSGEVRVGRAPSALRTSAARTRRLACSASSHSPRPSGAGPSSLAAAATSVKPYRASRSVAARRAAHDAEQRQLAAGARSSVGRGQLARATAANRCSERMPHLEQVVHQAVGLRRPASSAVSPSSASSSSLPAAQSAIIAVSHSMWNCTPQAAAPTRNACTG